MMDDLSDLEAVRHPYSKVEPVRGADAAIPFLAALRDQGINCFIAGGFARYVISQNDDTPAADDIDVYFLNREHYAHAVEVLVGHNRFTLNLETDNAVTLTPPEVGLWSPIQLQLIKPIGKRFGSVYDVLDNFDLNVCQAAIEIAKDSDKVYGYGSEAFFFGESNLKLKILNPESPLAIMKRCCKYSAKGYTISARELLKILLEWDKKDPEHKERVEKLVASKDYRQVYDLLGQ